MSLHLIIPGLASTRTSAIAAVAAIAWRAVRTGLDPTDTALLQRLRAGDEQAYLELVDRHQAAMLRLARTFVASNAVAEEVVQDTWLGVLRGIDGFAGRSTLRTWLLSILVNRARSTGAREARSVAVGDPEPAVDPARFDSAGAWSAPPRHWVEEIDDRVSAASARDALRDAVESLPRAPAPGGAAARRRGPQRRRGGGGARYQRGQPACAAASRPQPAARVARIGAGGGMRLRRQRELACRQVVELVSDYLEEALSRRERSRLQAHLAGCEHCSEYVAQMRATIALTGTLRAADLDPEMREALLGVYRRWRVSEA